MQVGHMGARRALEPVASASDRLCFICLGMDWHDMVSGMMERFSYDLEMQTREQSRNN